MSARPKQYRWNKPVFPGSVFLKNFCTDISPDNYSQTFARMLAGSGNPASPLLIASPSRCIVSLKNNYKKTMFLSSKVKWDFTTRHHSETGK